MKGDGFCIFQCRISCRFSRIPPGSFPARVPPVQGCLWVKSSVQLPQPLVHGKNKAHISNEEARMGSGQELDLAHICSKKTRF